MNIALVLAGGKGTRMGGEKPKQYIECDNKPILIHTLEAFAYHNEIDKICVICPAENIDYTREIVSEYKVPKVEWILPGGNTRRDSSFIGVSKIFSECAPDDIILIHDAARPNISSSIISNNIQMATEHGACETVIPSQDTIAVSEDGQTISAIPDRSKLFNVQTPQSFKAEIIYKAHVDFEKSSDGQVTDDAALVLRNGGKVFIVQGDKMNLKITTQEDLRILYNVTTR